MSLKKIFCILALLSITPLHARKPNTGFSLMIDPAGDAQHTGRTLDGTFERGITLQCAQALKEELEKRDRAISIILTRLPGEAVQPLQNAHFANRLAVDLYLNINFYQATSTKPHACIYAFSYGNDFVSQTSNLSFYTYDKAYLHNKSITRTYGQLMQNVLANEMYARQFSCTGLFFIPFRPLTGITAPALAFEASLKRKEDWHVYVQPLADSIMTLIEHHTKAHS